MPSRSRFSVSAWPKSWRGVALRASVTFRVPAYPERVYSGTVARIAHALDTNTRTMALELDVINRDGSLDPGMYPSVKWPVRRAHPGLFFPKGAVVTTTERTFVIRCQSGKAEWVDVKKGGADGNLVEVLSNLKAGDTVVRRATDELREGAAIK
jgi:membrane fusion protein, multidrug efflux system